MRVKSSLLKSAAFIITAPWNKKACLATVSVNIAQMSNYSFGTKKMQRNVGGHRVTDCNVIGVFKRSGFSLH